ncbi:MAG: HNH endonuclease [Actinomycetota bacterium]|nr:HNH endonuclease [Actinomycetota bacterium]
MQLHHTVHWVDGGHTDLDKLVSLCPRHHRNVHSGRLRIQTGGGQFRFLTQHGQQLHDHRPQSQRIVTGLTQQVLDLA